MSPFIKNGQLLLVNRLAYLLNEPQKADVVVLLDPRNRHEIVKRVTKVGKKRYFVEGDNSDESTDSRIFGWIEKKDIKGKVWKII